MIYSAYKLNKQGDNIHPWCSPFPICNQFVFHVLFYCCFLTRIQISQKAGQVVWYPHLFKNFPQFVVIHTTRHLFLWPELNVIQWLNSTQLNPRPSISIKIKGIATSGLTYCDLCPGPGPLTIWTNHSPIGKDKNWFMEWPPAVCAPSLW